MDLLSADQTLSLTCNERMDLLSADQTLSLNESGWMDLLSADQTLPLNESGWTCFPQIRPSLGMKRMHLNAPEFTEYPTKSHANPWKISNLS